MRSRFLRRVAAIVGASAVVAACAETPVAPPVSVDPPPADAAVVICLPDRLLIETPLVRALRDGIHIRFDNRGNYTTFGLHHQDWEDGSSEGGVLPHGMTEGRSSIAPGRVWVACISDPRGDYSSEGAAGGWFEVVDPDGLYAPFDLSCGSGEQFRLRIGAEDDEDPMTVFRRISGVRPDDELVPPLYPDSPRRGPSVIVIRDGRAIASFLWLGDVLVNACPGSGITPGEAP